MINSSRTFTKADTMVNVRGRSTPWMGHQFITGQIQHIDANNTHTHIYTYGQFTVTSQSIVCVRLDYQRNPENPGRTCKLQVKVQSLGVPDPEPSCSECSTAQPRSLRWLYYGDYIIYSSVVLLHGADIGLKSTQLPVTLKVLRAEQWCVSVLWAGCNLGQLCLHFIDRCYIIWVLKFKHFQAFPSSLFGTVKVSQCSFNTRKTTKFSQTRPSKKKCGQCRRG